MKCFWDLTQSIKGSIFEAKRTAHSLPTILLSGLIFDAACSMQHLLEALEVTCRLPLEAIHGKLLFDQVDNRRLLLDMQNHALLHVLAQAASIDAKHLFRLVELRYAIFIVFVSLIIEAF